MEKFKYSNCVAICETTKKLYGYNDPYISRNLVIAEMTRCKIEVTEDSIEEYLYQTECWLECQQLSQGISR